MWKLTQNCSSADKEVDNPCLEVDSSEMAEGSQAENIKTDSEGIDSFENSDMKTDS